MALVNINDLDNGTDADAGDINSRVAAILAEVNGNLDSTNIKDGAITQAKLANSSVTGEKLSLAASQANGGSYLKLGTVLIQWGQNNMVTGGTTVTFPMAFSAIPVVLTTVLDANNQTAWVKGKTTTNFTGAQIYSTNALPVQWIAIGVA